MQRSKMVVEKARRHKLAEWWTTDGSEVIWSPDFVGGIIIGIGLFIGGWFDSSVISGLGPAALYAEIALGVALLSAALVALSILVVFMDDDYVELLKASVGVRKVVFPYQVLAAISAAEVLFAFVSVIVWSVSPHWAQDLITSLTVFLGVWAIIGTVQIVNITARHGLRRVRMPEIRAAARQALKFSLDPPTNCCRSFPARSPHAEFRRVSRCMAAWPGASAAACG